MSVLMCVSFFSLMTPPCECLSQDWRGRACTLSTHLPSTDDTTLTALALHPTCRKPRWVGIVGGGGTRWVFQMTKTFTTA